MMAQIPNTVNIAICGLGRIGDVHFRSLNSNPHVNLVAVADAIVSKAQQAAVLVGPHCKAYDSLAKLLKDDENLKLHGVVICTPTGFHTENIKEVLNAGKQVMCEKPISYSLEEVDDCYNLAKEKGLHLLCAFQRRYDPNFTKLKAVLDSGRVGKLLKVRSTSRDNPVPSIEYLRTSGGIIFDCSVHDIDVLRYVTGEDPESVYAVGSAFNPEIGAIPDVDQLEMVLKFPSGVIGCIDISRYAVYGYDQRIEVLTHQGCIVAENQKVSTVVIGSKEGFLSEPSDYSFPQRYAEAYKAEVDHFIDLVRGVEHVPRLSHKDIHNLTVIVQTCQRSLKEGVPLPIKY
jgi:myo-inositol 2-dehydrogenase/D-chiro-inositol 1-dehydrogenase